MDLKLKPFDFNQAVARAGLRPDGLPIGQATRPAATEGANFRDAMTEALKSVSNTQTEATRLQREFTMENPNVSLEQVMIAGEKAKLGFTAAIGVRNRLVSAYSEIMNMQV
ncbi:MAG: flagellar hook-basal body complex protein FliE [Rubrivivax sp.]|nr:flagellar hook-basal body complex protein FliE [Rubrivivax sp.]